ncbi:MAG: hypothetical protein WA669_19205, partial [Pseudolabrys sp.]
DADSETLNNSHSYLINGTNVFAASQDDVEADRKGQRGHKAQHGSIISLSGLKCAHLGRSNLNRSIVPRHGNIELQR